MNRYRPHHLRPSLDTARVALVYRDFTGLGAAERARGEAVAR